MPCLSTDELYQHLGGELSSSDAARVRKHLETCEACAARLARFDDEHNDVLGHLRVAVGEQDTLPTDAAVEDVPVSRDASSPVEGDASLIPGYTILKELHRGGQGVVFQAVQTSTKRNVAIKLLLEGQFASKAARRRFEREIELAASLKHPNIVAIFDSGQTSDGRQFFVMDYVAGEPLTDYARGRKLGITETLLLYAKVCDAIQYAHQRGVIHRDLKPGNILVDSDGEPRVLDFGLAKQVGSASDTLLSMAGQIVGTLAYMSPEQARGSPDDVDTRTDVYTLGVILYEMLTGSTPYPVADAMAQVVQNILVTEPSRPSSVNRSLGDELDTMVLKLLSKEPARRYQSAGDAAADVRRYLAGEPIEAKRDSGWYVLRKTLGRHRVAIGTAAAFVVVMIGATIISARGWQRAAENERQAQDALVSLVRDGLRNWDNEAVAERAAAAGINVKLETEDGDTRFFVDPAAGEKVPQLAAFSKELFNWLRESESQARDNLKLAENRAEQLQQVADFQSAMFADLDVQQMGQTLESLYESSAADALQRRLGDTPETDEQIRAFKSLVRGLNATDVAIENLDQTILTRAQAAIDEQFADQPVVRAQLLTTIGVVYGNLGLADKAKPLLAEALAICERELGTDDPHTIDARQELGVVLGRLNEQQQAEDLLSTALAASRRIHGDRDLQTATLLESYGELLRGRGAYDDAEPLVREALAIRKAVSGETARDTLASMSRLAILLSDRGEIQQAHELLRSVVEIGTTTYGGDDPETIATMSSMATMLVALGKYDESIDVLRKALADSRIALGSNHPDTLGIIHDLAFAYRQKGDLDQAEKLYREALEGRRQALGADHPVTLISLNNFGGLLAAQGRLSEAVPYFEMTLEGLRAVYGRDHPNALATMNNLGAIHKSLGNYEKSEQFYRDALEGRRRILGDRHPNTLTTIGNLGVLLLTTGRIDEAEPLLREALEGRIAELGEDHPRTVVSMNDMGGLMKLKGEHDEAERWFRKALDKNRKIHGDVHAEVIRSLLNLGAMLAETGETAEACTLLAEATASSYKALPERHPLRGRVLVEYGWALLKEKRPEEAEPNLLHGHAILSDAGPAYEKYEQAAVQGLVELYEADGRTDKQNEWRAKLNAQNAAGTVREE